MPDRKIIRSCVYGALVGFAVGVFCIVNQHPESNFYYRSKSEIAGTLIWMAAAGGIGGLALRAVLVNLISKKNTFWDKLDKGLTFLIVLFLCLLYILFISCFHVLPSDL